MFIQNKKSIFIFFLLILVIVTYFLFKNFSNLDKVSTQELIKDPFAFIILPDNLDETTNNLLNDKIEQTKQKYANYPDDWASWIAIGNLYSTLGDYEHAIQAYTQSLSIDGANILGHRNIAEIYRVHIKDYKKAEAYYKEALKNNVLDPTLYITLGRLQFKQLEDPESAEKTFEEGLARTGNDNDILIQLIMMYQEVGDQDNLKQRVSELLLANPNNEVYTAEWGNIIK